MDISGNFKRIRKTEGLFIFLIIILILPNITQASINPKLPKEITVKAYWTSTITTDNKVRQKIEFIYQNQGNKTVHFNSTIAFSINKTVQATFIMPNGTETILYPIYDPKKNEFFIVTPKLTLEIEKNKFIKFGVAYDNLERLMMYPNGTHLFDINAGFEEPFDYFQYKLKIQKKTDFWNLITFTYIKKLGSEPETPPLTDEQEYKVIGWEKFLEKPSIQIIFYKYEYANDWNQLMLYLIPIVPIGFILFVFKRFKKAVRRTKKEEEIGIAY